ncbi:hypothetical protein Q0M94_05530 [Deinococcus radiomollis]|uniref:hypothetical protein n=1 Tax=Deinococcus radiomollis TaxID=468916 RepID=UPI003891EAAE
MTDILNKPEQAGRIPLGVGDAVPENMTTEQAAAFWDTHYPTRERLAALQPDDETEDLMARLRGGQPKQSPRQPRQPKATFVTSLRLDADVEARLKHVAALKQMPYQTLLKRFIDERLYEEEKRFDII